MLVLLFALSILLEIFAAARNNKVQKFLVICIVLLLTVLNGALIIITLSLFTGIIIVANLYRIINLLRIVEGRMQVARLNAAVRRTSCVLIFFQIILGLCWLANGWLDISGYQLVLCLAILQLITAGVLMVSVVRNLIKTRYRSPSKHLADHELPTVTVAIPARNETAALTACLEAVIASDYPKLEVLVLDDCSQDKTADIIREFAQAGVRFVPGDVPMDRWLGKNQAYAKLAHAATGSLILFCGVDVRLGNQAIRALITSLLDKQKQMISVLPLRVGGGLTAAFIQPMRYWWELAPPRRFFNRPPVLSSCWLISKNAIEQAGGFEAVSHAILPEAYFARQLIAQDGYSFIRSNDVIDVQTTKNWNNQYATALRVGYPQLQRRPENVLIMSLAELLLLLLPFVFFIIGFWAELGAAHYYAMVASVLLVVVHSVMITVTNPSNWWIGLLNFPVAVLADILLKNNSMWKYEFSVVEWKGRNICLPVMQNMQHLPNIEK